MALIQEFFDLTNKYQDDYGNKTILLMQVGSFFEVYGQKNDNGCITGSNIQAFSDICELNIVDKNVCVGKNVVVMAGFKDIMIEKYIKKIQDSGYTAVVYTQDEAMKGTTRSLAGIFSPGTYFAEENIQLSNNTICIWIERVNNQKLLKGDYVVVGMASIDIYTGKTSMFQYKENYIHSPTTYDELERFISIYNPNEIIFISALPEKEVKDIIHFININGKLIHIISLLLQDETINNKFTKSAFNCEKQIYQKEILERFYKIHDFDVFLQNFYNHHVATQSFCFLLDFIYQHNPYLIYKVDEPIFENCSHRLILANHSLKQINIISDDTCNYHGKFSSVLKMLNQCITPMGKRKFNYLLLNPTSNDDFLQKEYDITEHMISCLDKYSDNFKKQLILIKDLTKWTRQIYLKKLTPKSFCHLYDNVKLIKDLFIYLEKEDIKFISYFLEKERNGGEIVFFCDKIGDFISKHIDLVMAKELDCIQGFENNFIRKGMDLDLDKKTEMLNSSQSKLESIRDYLNSLVSIEEKKSKTTDFIKIHETEKNNYSLVTTQRRCKLLENVLPIKEKIVLLNYTENNGDIKEFELTISKKIIEFHKQSASNHCIYHPEINFLCKNISSMKNEMKDNITKVYVKFMKDMEENLPFMEHVSNFISLVDVIFCKATIASKYHYCKPVLELSLEKSFFKVKGLRHCIIEQLLQNEIYTTNDVSLGSEQVNGVLLYGTNAVGKTSFIRAIGIAVIMAQAGLFVPATQFIFKPYKYIFTRILGNDNIFKGLSTFAVEMSELRTILRLADKNSLILGDELCSGTENMSAISIFVAGIQRLHSLRSSFIFATHLHEIVDYSEIKEMDKLVLKHMSVIYNREKEMLIYNRKLEDGPGNSMYGLEVCKSLSLPEDFIAKAYEIRQKYNPLENSLLSLKTSHFNSKKMMSLCEKCGMTLGTEVHHLQHQSEAKNGFISGKDGEIMHIHSLANLVTLCDKCHIEFHKSDKQHKKVKTSKGIKLTEIV
jgi:DNA mismatch repair protein MutS